MTLRSNKKLLGLVIATSLLLGLLALQYLAPQTYTQLNQWLLQTQPGLYTVTKVIDGDTLAVEQAGDSYRVRLVGVDTPETHHPDKGVQCFGREASEYTRQLVEGKEVRLEADSLSDNQDRYQRLLRYVYLPDDETSVNQHIIEAGYGVSYRNYLHSKLPNFEQGEAEARKHQRGLWKSCDPEMNEFGVYETEAAQ